MITSKLGQVICFRKQNLGETIMAMKISEECTFCAACEPECPVEAISAGEFVYVIDAAVCIDCVGYNDSPLCVKVCPVDCISKA